MLDDIAFPFVLLSCMNDALFSAFPTNIALQEKDANDTTYSCFLFLFCCFMHGY